MKRLLAGHLLTGEGARSDRTLVRAVWVGIAIQVAGRIFDGWWHATHDEFERGFQQLEAHWLAWLGVLVTLIAAGAAMKRLGIRNLGLSYGLVLSGVVLYVVVAIWHFLEHLAHNDPAPPHVLLVVATAMMFVGAVLLLFRGRQANPSGRGM